MGFKGFQRHRFLRLVIVLEVMDLDATEVERLAYIVLLLEIRQEFRIVDFPAQAFHAAVEKIGGINKSVSDHGGIIHWCRQFCPRTGSILCTEGKYRRKIKISGFYVIIFT